MSACVSSSINTALCAPFFSINSRHLECFGLDLACCIRWLCIHLRSLWSFSCAPALLSPFFNDCCIDRRYNKIPVCYKPISPAAVLTFNLIFQPPWYFSWIWFIYRSLCFYQNQENKQKTLNTASLHPFPVNPAFLPCGNYPNWWWLGEKALWFLMVETTQEHGDIMWKLLGAILYSVMVKPALVPSAQFL